MKCNSLALAVLLAGFAASAWAQTPISGTSKCGKPDTSQTIEVGDQAGHVRGYAVLAMDNGDKAYVRYQGTGITSKDGNLTATGTWSYTGGTGKLKGLKGKGTYKTSGTPDGTAEAQVEGDYSLREPGATAKKK